MNFFGITRFADPQLLWLLVLVPLSVVLHIYRGRKTAVNVSTIEGALGAPRTFRHYLRHVPFVLRCAALAALIIALARPQNTSPESGGTTEGIDIVLSMDISGSMLSRDFTPDRMEAAKQTASQFIAARPHDRIGLVAFAAESFTQSPMTTDGRTLQMLLEGLRIGLVDDGTAIGNGLATAINRLRESTAESKVIILLTDGMNNAGQIAPLTAAEIARTLGIRVYTIGVGTRGTAPSPSHYDMFGRLVFIDAPVEIDEQILTDIASATGGEYFRATDNGSLEEVYKRIDALEKSRIEADANVEYHELFMAWALAALGLLVLEFVVRRLAIRELP
jgi:Ca-activated chloride channel family protein